jgi:hypothetical protein
MNFLDKFSHTLSPIGMVGKPSLDVSRLSEEEEKLEVTIQRLIAKKVVCLDIELISNYMLT